VRRQVFREMVPEINGGDIASKDWDLGHFFGKMGTD